MGFVVLIKGADWLVEGAASIARTLGISDLIVGLTIVAFGTSAPELLVNVLAAGQGSTDLAIGNVIGSNIANILLILGVSAFIYPITVERNTVWKEIPFALLAAVLMGILPNDSMLEDSVGDGARVSALTRIDGLVLLCFLSVFLYYVYEAARNSESPIPPEMKIEQRPVRVSVFMCIGGLVGLTLGGKWVVDGALATADLFQVSEELVGLSLVAIGTSLPELATGIVAALRKNSSIVVGNAVGSNIFNIFLVLGVSSTITELPLDTRSNADIMVMIVTTVLLFASMFIGAPKYFIGRREGIFFLIVYVAYMVMVFIRG